MGSLGVDVSVDVVLCYSLTGSKLHVASSIIACLGCLVFVNVFVLAPFVLALLQS